MPPKLLAFVGALAVLASGCNCGVAGAPGAACKTSTDCAKGNVCAAGQTCAVACTADAACGASEKCSPSGSCVPKQNGCGADTECAGGLVCLASLTCGDSCLTTPCAAGSSCGAAGHCVANLEDGGPATCGGQLFESTRVQANFLIVLDHSGSMKDPVAGVPKWDSAVAAVKQVTSAHDAEIRFGLELFSTPTQCKVQGVVVPVGDAHAQAIASALPAVADGKGTPIADALHVAGQAPELADATRANNILLITDGMENCNGDPVAQTKANFAKGIKTYVVGFGGEVDQANLSAMAVEGGTARSGTPKYYQADNAAALNTAMDSIAKGALGCDFKLSGTPPDTNKIYIYVNGKLALHDPTKVNGWEYVGATNRVTLFGPTCSLVTNDPATKVQIVYGCPDSSIVEGPADGGAADNGDGGTIG